jgi:hypothetical protein
MSQRIDVALARAIKSGQVPTAIEIGADVYDELQVENIPTAALVGDSEIAPTYTDEDLEVRVYASLYGELPIIQRDDVPDDYINVLS